MKIRFDKKFKKILQIISNLSEKKIYIAGGFLRDYFLGSNIKSIDIDIVCEELKEVLKNIKKLQGKLILLDKKRNTYRFVLKNKIILDINALKSDLRNDYESRDFTINSLYYDIKTKKIIDLSNCLKHIKLKIIKQNNENVFEKDYLRILRMFRIAGEHNLKIDKATMKNALKNKKKIFQVSKERITYEILKLINSRNIKIIELFYKSLKTEFNLKNNIDKIKKITANYNKFTRKKNMYSDNILDALIVYLLFKDSAIKNFTFPKELKNILKMIKKTQRRKKIDLINLYIDYEKNSFLIILIYCLLKNEYNNFNKYSEALVNIEKVLERDKEYLSKIKQGIIIKYKGEEIKNQIKKNKKKILKKAKVFFNINDIYSKVQEDI